MVLPRPDLDNLPWKGPVVSGTTQSILGDFIQCPYQMYFKAILGLEEDTPPHENLVWGDCYHVGLEHLIRGDPLIDAQRAAISHFNENYAQFDHFSVDSYRASIPGMLNLYDLSILPEGPWITEDEIDQVKYGYRFRGKRDGHLIGEAIAEHKCKKQYAIDPQLLREEIEQDLQCNVYMHLSEVETVYYDLIGIPESVKYGAPYKRRNVSDKQYMKEVIYGGDYKPNDKFPILDNSHMWVHQAPYFIPAHSQEMFWQRTVLPLVRRLHEWFDYVTDPNFDPNNPDHYNTVFYIMPVRTFRASNTEKFKCNYHGVICGNEDVRSLRPIKGMFTELSSEEPDDT